jgi:hypothetical protein
MKNDILDRAKQWVERDDGTDFLTAEEYCSTRDIFQARLEKFRLQIEQSNFLNASLLAAVLGEIGNNAFDHNLGNWRDVPGVYFDTQKNRASVIIADRGQGVRKTISRVRPETSSDAEALKIAFTEIISGRSPEQRGNGLKFVKRVISQQKWNLTFISGNGMAMTDEAEGLNFCEIEKSISGCIALIQI